MTCSWISRGGCSDCDHHVLRTRLSDRREMASRSHDRTFWLRSIGVFPYCVPGGDLPLQFQESFLWVGPAYMENSGSCKSAERISLEAVLQRWFADQGVSQEGATRAVCLLDASTLLAQPRPSRWNRRGAFGVQERCRYLWYRHAARILGWCDRRRFPDLVTGILRGHAFPTEVVCDEATGEAGKGSVAAGTHSRPLRIDADQISAGQYSCTWTHIA